MKRKRTGKMTTLALSGIMAITMLAGCGNSAGNESSD